MSEALRIFLGLCLLAAVFVLTRYIVTWRFRRAADSIISDLQAKGALDASSAIALSYAKSGLIRIGMRDYYSKAMEYMVSEGVLGLTDSGKYYLRIESNP